MKRNQVEAEFAATARKGRILCRAKVAGPRDRAEDSSAAISILNLFVQDRDTRSSYCVWKRGGNHTTTTWDSLEIPTPPDSHWGESESGSGGHGGMGKGGRAEARHEALPHTSPGGKPPETPRLYLTRTGLLMEAATVRERSACPNFQVPPTLSADVPILPAAAS